MSIYLGFEPSGRLRNEEFIRDNARLYQLENRQRRQLDNDSNERRKSQPRGVRFEDEWDPGIANTIHGSRLGESRV